MSDDPNPLSDVRRGLGLLLRAARTAARKWPSADLEEVVTTSAREVGRAIENVASTVEREVFRRGSAAKPPRREDGDPAKPKPDAPAPPPGDEGSGKDTTG